MNCSRGLFISFEGIEGAGKSTQIQCLANFLRERGKEVLLTREPGGTLLGEDVRKILKFADYGDGLFQESEALLFAAARAQLVREVILPALSAGTIVISDRFTDSSIAYQGAGRNLGKTSVENINVFATGGLQPDWTILLDIDPELGFARIHSRDAENADKVDRMETFPADFYCRVRQAYCELAEKDPQRFFVVPATESQEFVKEKIESEFVKRFSGTL